MKINTKKADAVWFDFDETIKFKVRRLPMSAMKMDIKDPMENSCYEFNYCLVDWAGITEEDNNTEYPCNDDNKQYIFDYYSNIVAFVKQKALDLTLDLYNDLKN